MARAAFALSSPHRSRNVIAALANELDAAICVWVNPPLIGRQIAQAERHRHAGPTTAPATL
jgi:hypothetical protein